MKAVRNPKKNILVSFSGGETSAYMIKYLKDNYKDYNLIYVFANTGEENEETLVFVDQCEKYFGIKINWIEFDLKDGKPSYKHIDFKSAYRSHDKNEICNQWRNHPFRKMIQYFGIPNTSYSHCSRELKAVIITKFMRDQGFKNGSYDTAIGIRSDELNRIGEYFYPLIYANVTKQHINDFWSKMPFRLNLKGYQGNCKTCWKKSDRKLITIMREDPRKFDFFSQMELEYFDHNPDNRQSRKPPYLFFRQNRSVIDLHNLSLTNIKSATDDSVNANYQTGLFEDIDLSNGCYESCEAF